MRNTERIQEDGGGLYATTLTSQISPMTRLPREAIRPI